MKCQKSLLVYDAVKKVTYVSEESAASILRVKEVFSVTIYQLTRYHMS